jgi:hypothetical protein
MSLVTSRAFTGFRRKLTPSILTRRRGGRWLQNRLLPSAYFELVRAQHAKQQLSEEGGGSMICVENRLALSTHLCATSVPFLFDTFGANWLRAVPKRRIPVKKGWQFAVVGCDANEVPHYLGFAETYDRAAQLRESTKLLGWRRVAVFDAELRELTARPNA